MERQGLLAALGIALVFSFWLGRASATSATGRPAPPSPAASGCYPARLVRADGSKMPLDGRKLRIDLDRGRMLEIDLRRIDRNGLHLWAPTSREDGFHNLLVLRPMCANSLVLELDRVKVRRSAHGFSDLAGCGEGLDLAPARPGGPP
jgi:hypothetical protein